MPLNRIGGRAGGGFVRVRRRWRAGILQLLFVIIGIVLGLLLTRVRGGAVVSEHRSDQVLGTVGFGIIGLVSVIYSLLFLVVQSANTTFSPRLNLFRDDPWIWRTYALALGLFAYSISALLAVGEANTVSVLVPLLAFATALGIIGLIRWILMSAFASLQLSSVLDHITTSGMAVIRRMYPQPVATAEGGAITPPPNQEGRPVRWAADQTTLQQLDLRKLTAEAQRTGSSVVFNARVGATIWEGSTVATIHGDLSDRTVRSCCLTGLDRTFEQDPLLAFRLLADIGLRALSPAVNDPATAVQALDAIVGLLMVLAERDLEIGAVSSDAGDLRVWVNVPTWSDFVTEGLDELLAASPRSPMMVGRAVATLNDLAEQVSDARRGDIEARRRMVAS